MTEYKRGVIVDKDGYIISTIQWDAKGLTPRVSRGQTLITDETAVETVQSGARWSFTGEWLLPTERRWSVMRRRDNPDYWFMTGSHLVWPQRLPQLPAGQRWIAEPPPQFSRGRRPIWSESQQAWLMPKRKAEVAADGTILNFIIVYQDSDYVAADGKTLEDVENGIPQAQDEKGETVPCRVGDRIVGGIGTILNRPRYKRVPVRLLEQVLADNSLTAAFASFVTSNGYTIEEVRGLGTISLNNKLLRQFVADQGFTLAQAYNALQRAAEDLEAQEISRSDLLGAEE